MLYIAVAQPHEWMKISDVRLYFIHIAAAIAGRWPTAIQVPLCLFVNAKFVTSYHSHNRLTDTKNIQLFVLWDNDYWYHDVFFIAQSLYANRSHIHVLCHSVTKQHLLAVYWSTTFCDRSKKSSHRSGVARTRRQDFPSREGVRGGTYRHTNTKTETFH